MLTITWLTGTATAPGTYEVRDQQGALLCTTDDEGMVALLRARGGALNPEWPDVVIERQHAVLEQYLADVESELSSAMRGHPPLHSHHEALAVIEEEVAEYRSWVHQKPAARVKSKMYSELVQIAAMCLRAVIDRDVTTGEEEVRI